MNIVSPSPTGRPRAVSLLGQMVLIRLLAGGKAPGRADIDKALKRYFADRLAMAPTQWGELLSGTITELQQQQCLETKPFRLTELGRQQAITLLGVDVLPARATWQLLKNRYVIGLALGIRPSSKTEWERLGRTDGLRAAVLAKHYQLPSGPVPSIARALHELAWQQLLTSHDRTVLTGKDFTRNNVLAATLLAGRPAGKPEEPLAAMAVGASGTSGDKVRDAVICRWLDGADSDATLVQRFDLGEFAKRVRELAQTATEGRFGEHKVFIETIWNRFEPEADATGMTRDEFTRRLIDANSAELLTLSRADLVGAMDPTLVHSSEIRLPDASFHFVRTDY